jgi:hypothetical protein
MKGGYKVLSNPIAVELGHSLSAWAASAAIILAEYRASTSRCNAVPETCLNRLEMIIHRTPAH